MPCQGVPGLTPSFPPQGTQAGVLGPCEEGPVLTEASQPCQSQRRGSEHWLLQAYWPASAPLLTPLVALFQMLWQVDHLSLIHLWKGPVILVPGHPFPSWPSC